MMQSRSGSIHDLDHAPEAPDVSSLTFEELSPRTSLRGASRRSMSPSSMHNSSPPPMFLSLDVSDIIAPRRRTDSAPGRLSDIDEHYFGNASISVSGSNNNNNNNNNNNSKTHCERLSYGFSDFDEEHQDDDDDYNDSGHFYDSEDVGQQQQRKSKGFFGFHLSHGLFDGFGVSRISACLVRNAPCFWCFGNSLDVGATDRSILYRLNILCAFFAIGQVVAGALLMVALYSTLIVDRQGLTVVARIDSSNNISMDLWNLNPSVFAFAIIGVIVLITAICTLRVVREVNLRGAVRYLWTMMWLLPLQIFFVIALFDAHQVTEVWVTHWWYLPSMAWFREVFCPTDTSNDHCVVPVGGGLEHTSELNWCKDLFHGATNCTEIRDQAQAETTRFMYIFYYSCGIWGIVLVVLLLLVIRFLEGIITKDIVQSSKESNVPCWMLLPITGCFFVGSVFLFSPSSAIAGNSESTNSQWVGVLYIVGGGCFFITALLGWFIGQFSILNSQDKRNKNLVVICFIGINVVIMALLAAVFVGSVLVSIDLVDVPLSNTTRGRAACTIDTAQSCSYCGNRIGIPECPEWTEAEVIKVLQTQYKSSATFAVIFVLYAISATRFGVVLKRHISMYQIDYI